MRKVVFIGWFGSVALLVPLGGRNEERKSSPFSGNLIPLAIPDTVSGGRTLTCIMCLFLFQESPGELRNLGHSLEIM